MDKLFCAVDETNDGEFLAFVVCDEISLKQHMLRLPKGFTHISDSKYPQPNKKQIIDNLNLNGNTLAFCVRFDIPTVKEMLENSGLGKTPKKKIQQKISYRMISTLNDMFSSFLLKQRFHLKDLSFEVDNDTVKRFLNDGGLCCIKPSGTHKIADCIAYANLRRWEVKGNVKELGQEYSEVFLSTIRKDFEAKK